MGTSQLSSLLPQALSEGVMSSGGLGLAAQLARETQSAHGALHAQPSQTSGGTAAHAPGDASATTGGVGA